MTNDSGSATPQIQHLPRPEGHIGYEIAGQGPLVVLVPGMGDLRSAYRFVAPALRAAGYRVAATDLRGHGDSAATFSSYGDIETAADLEALVEHLGGPAVVVGNSMGAGAAALLSARRPDLVSALVLLGPFVRNGQVSRLGKVLLRLAMAAPWAARSWLAYLPRLYAGTRPADFDGYLAHVRAALQRPGYAKAFSLTTRTDHGVVEARLPEVKAPALVIMGEHDPDFPDPAAEAAWIASTLGAQVVMAPDSGHYPHSQQPDLVVRAITGFLATAGHDTQDGRRA